MAAHHADNDTANNLTNYTTPRDSYKGVYRLSGARKMLGVTRTTKAGVILLLVIAFCGFAFGTYTLLIWTGIGLMELTGYLLGWD
jgi:hypothetical protein